MKRIPCPDCGAMAIAVLINLKTVKSKYRTIISVPNSRYCTNCRKSFNVDVELSEKFKAMLGYSNQTREDTYRKRSIKYQGTGFQSTKEKEIEPEEGERVDTEDDWDDM